MMSTGMVHNDLGRLGAGSFMASPRQANVMIISGTVSTKMAERMTRLYEQMPEPKWVIAMRACTISGGPGPREFCRTSCSRTRKFFDIDKVAKGEARGASLAGLSSVSRRQHL